MTTRWDIPLLYTGEDAEKQALSDASVVVENGVITYVGLASEAPDCDDIRREPHTLMMPALYNAHTHLAMTMLRGAGNDLNLHDWLFDAIFPREEKLTRKHIAVATRLALMECLRFGVVGVADMYFEMDEVARAVLEAGMRASLCRGLNGTDINEFKQKIADNEAFFHEFNGAEGRITVPVGLHAEYTTTPEMLRLGAESAAKLGTGTHIHCSETRAEHEACIERHGMTPTMVFDRAGLLDLPQPALLAHGVHMTAADLEYAAWKRAFIAHCPASNLKLGSGVFLSDAALSRGLRVAMGTDGAASNNRLDILAEMRLAALLAKGPGDPSRVPAHTAIAMATRNAAAACGVPEAGSIRVGAPADFILLDLSAPHAHPVRDAAGHIAYAADGLDVLTTVCAGRVLYHRGEYMTLDAGRITAEFDACWRDLDA